MSRIGRAPIIIPENVTADITVDGNVIVTGPKGTLREWVDMSVITVNKTEVDGKNCLVLTRANDQKEVRSKHGLYRALLANMVKGVTEGYSKTLLISGVGYKAQVNGNKLVMNIGFSHPVNFEIPTGIEITTPNATEICVKGIDKELVGQVAADIKAVKPVEPYHGYGIRYKDQFVLRKEVKKASKKK